MRTRPLPNRNGALLAALLFASCSHQPTGPTATPTSAQKASETGGLVHGSAAGDVKNGPIEMDLVRVAQTNGVPAFYANAGGEYVVRPKSQVEIYVQIWTSNPAVVNPRLIIDWGVGERDNTGCGSCRLTRTYETEGKYTVKVTMDDRISGTTSRTFTLNVQNVPPEGPVKAGFGTFSGSLAVTDPQFNRKSANFVPPATGPCNSSGNIPNYYDTYQVTHLGGTMRIETLLGTLTDTYLHVYSGSFNPSDGCQNLVAGNDDNGLTFASLIQATFPAGNYVVVVTSFDPLDTGTYTLIIQ